MHFPWTCNKSKTNMHKRGGGGEEEDEEEENVNEDETYRRTKM